ncbi:MAG TPA: UvrD-helicase domain-containing protein [Ruminococcus sp.]|nr:UvrD-helicase domain-containing protein [Ruminococcus sp.]
MIKSNISIVSNIYIRSDPDITKDRRYTEKITGAKRIQDIQRQYIGFQKISLSSIQEKISSENVSCVYAKNGEKTHGPVIMEGKLEWVNRCEYTSCQLYEDCVSIGEVNVPHREPIIEDDSDDKKSLQDFFKSIGIIIQDDTVLFERDRNTAIIEESSKEYAAPKELSVEEIRESSKKYIEITDSDCIITAPLDSHIILNSGPGTGKTFTIIQRLIYILTNNLCPAEEIYILCYTRSAKKVVEDKIEQAVVDGIIQPSAKNICVLTFDSYATYFLMAMRDQGVIRENFDGYEYNERIKLFNKYISADDFEGISYFIVDEIQDLVNERAEMVLKILSNLKCGYLLAGDRCQSIYDYAVDGDATIDSVEFYKRAEKHFPDDMLRYEITVNRRQAPELADEAAKMRKVLLNDSIMEQNKYANSVILNYSGKTKVEQYIKTLSQAPTVSTAILCRNNGEAEYISGLLCEKGIVHTLNRGVNNVVPLPRWIADVFWDYCRPTIIKRDFIERFTFRCDSKMNPEVIWELLCKLTDSQDKAVINVPKLWAALTITNNIPSEFFGNAPMLTVSTIHKAKGSEFDRVILIESDIKPSSDSAEEARIRYVALTRPKTQFITMKKNTKYFKRTMSGRVIETGLHNIYKTNNKYCKCITVGLTGDIDNNSFVSGDFDSILDLQEYIIHSVKLYDKLSAKRSVSSSVYEIYHNSRCIGCLSKKMTAELDMGVSSTDYKYNLPDSLENFYVSGITTEVLKQFDASVPVEYQKSRICYGIQITGLAKLVFEKK